MLDTVKNFTTPNSTSWLHREPDQEFNNFDDMLPYLEQIKFLSESTTVKNREIQLLAPEKPETREELNQLAVSIDGASPIGMSHWSFSQLCGLAKAPSGFMRALPSQLVRDNLLYMLHYSRDIESVMAYSDRSKVKAFTGPSYGRVDDYEIALAVSKLISDDGRWEPADQHMGFRATDRSLNIFLIDKQNPIIVGKTKNGDDDILYRGLRISNSETGACSLSVEAFIFRNYCLNGMIFGLKDSERVSIRHSKNAPYRWAEELRPAIESYANQDNSSLVERVDAAKKSEIGYVDEQVIGWLKTRGFNAAQQKNIMQRCEEEEGKPARTIWDITQGITAVARDIEYVDERATMERLGGKIFDMAR